MQMPRLHIRAKSDNPNETKVPGHIAPSRHEVSDVD